MPRAPIVAPIVRNARRGARGGAPSGGRATRRDAELAPIPRDAGDDFGSGAVQARRDVWRSIAHLDPRHVEGVPVPLESARGKIENLVGFAQVPLGIAGPLRVETSLGWREVYVPMATTEGAMVASYSRGMKLLAAGRGPRARVLREGLTQNPILVYADARAAEMGAEYARRNVRSLARIVAGTTGHGKLTGVRAETIGRRLVLSFVFTTGDAIGINMAARAADVCSAEIARRTGASSRYVHGQDVEKRANARATSDGRGRSVVADVIVPRASLAALARTTPEAMAAIARSYAVGFAQLSTSNWLVQAANGLSAVMLACGQDVAYVTECATGFLDLDVTAEGDLYASAFLPSLLVGTVGGGSAQGTAAECLDLLGCRIPGGANLFAEILCATVLAGDLSLMAAFCSHEFVAAHERLGRNRPPERREPRQPSGRREPRQESGRRETRQPSGRRRTSSATVRKRATKNAADGLRASHPRSSATTSTSKRTKESANGDASPRRKSRRAASPPHARARGKAR